MTTAAALKMRRGDFVMVRPSRAFTGITAGLYIVLDAGPAGVCVTPTFAMGNKAPLLGAADRLVIQAEDYVAHFRPVFVDVDALPASLDVSKAPAPRVDKPAAPERADPPLVLVSIADPMRKAVELVRFATSTRKAETVHLDTFETDHVNEGSNGASRLACWVPIDLVEQFINGLPGSYRIEGIPVSTGKKVATAATRDEA